VILLDTNVISELMRPTPDAYVQAWIDDKDLPELATTSVNLAEIGYGIALLPEGRRKDAMQSAAENVFARLFGDSVLPFDAPAAGIYSELAAAHRHAGRSVGILDLQTAAIAKIHDFALATRNTRHFANCGIELIDPFTPAAGPTAGR